MNENINVDRLFLSKEESSIIPSQPSYAGGGFLPIDIDSCANNAVSVTPLGFVTKLVIDDIGAIPNTTPDLAGVGFRMFFVSPVINSCWVTKSFFYGYQLILNNPIPQGTDVAFIGGKLDTTALSFFKSDFPEKGYNVSAYGSFYIPKNNSYLRFSLFKSSFLPILTFLSNKTAAIDMDAGVYYGVGSWGVLSSGIEIGYFSFNPRQDYQRATDSGMPTLMGGDDYSNRVGPSPLFLGYYPSFASMPDLVKMQFPPSFRS